jgi:regulator of replication initiation timing
MLIKKGDFQMKTRILTVMMCVILLLLSACVKIGDGTSNLEQDYKTSIKELEKKIETMLLTENEKNKLEFEKLRLEIANLKEAEVTSETTKQETELSPKFIYKVNDGKATITGYTGNESYIVIPSIIDGYEVEAVGDSAFHSSKITTVIISEGVKKIDWFAFYSCPYLISVTLPMSITSIGYAAFDGASSSFTIYCHKNSYSYNYALSCGFTYVVV